MKVFAIFLIIFGIIILIFPDIIAYLIAGFFIFLGINILFMFNFKKNSKNGENYVKFGNYKIYR